MKWSEFYQSTLVDGGTISGLSGIETLLERSPYHTVSSYFVRVEKAVESFPLEHQEAALAAFGAVTYASRQMLDATHEHFFSQLERLIHKRTGREIQGLIDLHLFEVDPSGLLNEFVLRNKLPQRLNHTVLSRISTVDDILIAIEDLKSLRDDRQAEAAEALKQVAVKPIWVVLTDKALSGQSLCKDLQRIALLRDLVANRSERPPTICVCAQVFTSDAFSRILRLDIDNLEVISGLLLDERMKVTSPACALFPSSKLQGRVLEACTWFAEHVLAADRSFDAVREQSGDSLAFGYRASGLLFSDYNNCPTNSVPMLWHTSHSTGADYSPGFVPVNYEAPFPRVDSRRGPELPRRSSTRWLELPSSEEFQRAQRFFSEVGNAP